MSEKFKLTEDGQGIVYIPEDTVAPNLQCVVDNLNKATEELEDLKKIIKALGVPIELAKDFQKWDEIINWLDKTNRRLVEIEEIHQAETDRILEEARETEVDFKAIYGANNQKVRQQYVDEHLTELIEEKKELEFLKDNDNRRISFLKRLIDMKIELMKINGE